MRKITYISITLLMVVFQSCEKEDDKSVYSSTPFPKTEFYFTASINQNKFESTNSTAQLTVLKDGNNYFNTLTAFDNGQCIKIIFNNVLLANSYDIESAYYASSPYDFWNYYSVDTTGRFTITNYDSVNKYLSGTFYFKVKKVGFDETKLIKGEFKKLRIIND